MRRVTARGEQREREGESRALLPALLPAKPDIPRIQKKHKSKVGNRDRVAATVCAAVY